MEIQSEDMQCKLHRKSLSKKEKKYVTFSLLVSADIFLKILFMIIVPEFFEIISMKNIKMYYYFF